MLGKNESLKNGPVFKEGFNFLDQEVYDASPMLESVDKQGRTIEPKVTPTSGDNSKKKDGLFAMREFAKKAETEIQEPGETQGKENRGHSERVARVNQNKNGNVPVTIPAPEEPLDQKMFLKEEVVARYTLEEFKREQDMDMVVSSLKRLMKRPKGKLTGVLKELREGIQAYFRQVKDRLFVNR